MNETSKFSATIVLSMVLLGATVTLNVPYAAYAQTITPSSINETINVGEELPQTITVELDPAEVPVDVYFVVDLSGSFDDDLEEFKDQAESITTDLEAMIPDVQFGVGSLVDYPISPFGSAATGDYAYMRNIAITDSTADVLTTIDGLAVFFGGDGPQSQLPALFQSATGAGQDTNSDADFADAEDIGPGQDAGFREGSVRILILWTDADFHLPGDPGDVPYPGPSFADAIDALNDESIKVIGIAALPSSSGDPVADLSTVASGTGTLAPTGGVDCNSDAVIDIAEGDPVVCEISADGSGIADAVVATVEAVAFEADLSLMPVDNLATAFDETSLVVSIAPTVFENIDLEVGGTFVFDIVKTCTEDAADVNEFEIQVKLDDTVIGTVPVTIECNSAPDCSAAGPSLDTLWPPNHKMKEVTITGVTDADGDQISITISSIFQDEPTNGLGDGDQSPDGDGIGTDTAHVRAERSGLGDGRVYHISFTADDGNGGTCSGEVIVSVPHDQSGAAAIDQGALFDSTVA